MSLRRAPSIKGAGMLAQVPESEILARADSEDSNHDGIMGHAPWVTAGGKRVLGRFGWKATQPDLPAQIAAAFSRDIGLSTRLRPDPWGDCTPAQRACRAGPHGSDDGEPEVADALFDLVVGYVASLAPPRPAKSAAGEKLFAGTGCAACHATLHLANGTPVPAYTDLLLHDMGEGLADGRPAFAASGNEWRTPPLWGLGLIGKVNGHTFLLHDGRARNVSEAILWHGGEASASRERFRAMSQPDRAALLAFLSSL
jgi:CxxC motif-containing protein (DUF1111 family)